MKKFAALFIALCMSVSLCVSTLADTQEKDYRTPENFAYHTLVDALNKYKDEHNGKYPDEYLAKWIGNSALHIALTTDDEAVTAWYDDILYGTECEIIYEVSPYSYNQLEQLRDAISNTGFDPAIWSMGINNNGYVEVTVDGSLLTDTELEKHLREFAESLGMPADSVVLVESPMPVCEHEPAPQTDEQILSPETSDAITTAAVMAVVSLLGFGIAKKKK